MSATGNRTGRPEATIRTLWAIAKSEELRLTNDDLHAIVYRETQKDSLKKLSQRELNLVSHVLQKMKDTAAGKKSVRRTDMGGNPHTIQQRRKIYALCEELGWNDDPRRIHGFAKRMCGVERIEWLNMAQCEKVIEGLKAIAAREKNLVKT